jgi:hypothetical protein
MSHAQAKQELAEARNPLSTIAQFRKSQAPFKRKRREGWNNRREYGTDLHGHEQQGVLENVTVPEGAGPGPSQLHHLQEESKSRCLELRASHQIWTGNRNMRGPIWLVQDPSKRRHLQVGSKSRLGCLELRASHQIRMRNKNMSGFFWCRPRWNNQLLM